MPTNHEERAPGGENVIALHDHEPDPLPPAVNFHLWRPCNMKCRYCFATFEELAASHLSEGEMVEIVRQLAAHPNVKKITFAGGEPTLCRWLEPLVRAAKAGGLTTMLVTNGTRLAGLDWVFADDGPLDWVAFSVDSTRPATNVAIGRAVKGDPLPVDSVLELAVRLRAAGVRVKQNTVVSSQNVDEDMSEFVAKLRPERWKILQVLPVAGQNDAAIDDFVIDEASLRAFVRRHQHLVADGITLVPETNVDMRGSYAMIDPEGRFFDNTAGRHRYGPRILDVGVQAAWDGVAFSMRKFIARDGLYAYARGRRIAPGRLTRRHRLIVLTGPSGSGKDTVAELLRAYEYQRVAIADPLKRGLRALIGLTDAQLWGDRRNEALPELGVSPRRLMQVVSDALLELDPKLWIRRWRRELEERLDRGELVVCTDVRTCEELEVAYQLGATTVRIVRAGAAAPGVAATHRTETELSELDDDCFDVVLHNDGTLEELRREVRGQLLDCTAR